MATVPVLTRPLLAAAVTLALTAVVLTPIASRADDANTLTVVGTSDVSDSNLMAAVIKPGFEAAYPGITLNYVPQGTGPAITTAESGEASVLLVHAASLENQFVAQGFSEEQYGRAIFYGDYVLLGPAADPAGVMSGGDPSRDIATAFEKIAAAGANNEANFVSRGGTPGTTVEEHAIWALTSGVTTCAVSAANGGGVSPSTTTGDCPTTISYPSWYHATGLSQAPNLVNADVCNYPNSNCYVLTDRGTFDYLESTDAISNLQIVTHNNAKSARGGNTLLINSFHAYAVNPAKFADDPNVHLNLTGAEDFLNWITSPAGQAAVGNFEADQGDPPFQPDAAPSITLTDVPSRHVTAGDKVEIKGRIKNVVKGTPPLAGVLMSLTAKGSGPRSTVATDTTSATGHFTLRYRPTETAKLVVRSPQISQVEIPTPVLTPPFGDILVPTSASRDRNKIGVTSAVTLDQPIETGGKVELRGRLTPKVHGSNGKLRIYANPVTDKSSTARTLVAKRALAPGAHKYKVHVALKPGKKWVIRVGYANRGVLSAGLSKPRKLVV